MLTLLPVPSQSVQAVLELRRSHQSRGRSQQGTTNGMVLGLIRKGFYSAGTPHRKSGQDCAFHRRNDLNSELSAYLSLRVVPLM